MGVRDKKRGLFDSHLKLVVRAGKMTVYPNSRCRRGRLCYSKTTDEGEESLEDILWATLLLQ